MPGFFAALAAQQLAETEARLLAAQQAMERDMERHRQEYELLRREHEAQHGVVIDVEAREVPDQPALPAP